MHIFYHEANGAVYARLGHSVRNGDKVSKESINLGRVIDKEKGIYKNRERGVFQYDLATDTYTSISAPEEKPRLFLSAKTGKGSSLSAGVSGTEKKIVDLGDMFFLDAFLKKEGLDELIDAIGYQDRDTLYALLSHRLLDFGDDSRAKDWYPGSYASILYPQARLSDLQIAEVYAAIGKELSLRSFFGRYLPLLWERAASEGWQEEGYVLIDSAGSWEEALGDRRYKGGYPYFYTGSPQRGGRLLYVVRQSTGLPVFFRYCQDKEADVGALVRTIRELEAYKIYVKLAILDAGYYSGDSIEELYAHGVSFITKPREDLKLYKKLAADSLSALVEGEGFVSCDVRYPYIKCVPCKVGRKNHPACAYVCLAPDQDCLEAYRKLLDTKNRSLTDGDMHDMIQARKILLFVSSKKLAPDKLLPAYDTRQYMEQFFLGAFFDGGRVLSGLPAEGEQEGAGARERIGAQQGDVSCGQLLLRLIADVIRERIQDRLQGSPYALDELLLNLRNQKGKVYRDRVIVQKASKKASAGYKQFRIACPTEILRR